MRAPTKYRAKSCIYNGRIYHSRREADYARALDLMKRATTLPDSERPTEIKPQAKVSLDVNGCHVANYYCDFKVTFADGHVEWHEVKGFETETWRLKRKLFEALYPEEILVVVK